MAKLLTEEEYNALLADRERLEWLAKNGGKFDPGMYPGDGPWLLDQYMFPIAKTEGLTMREAIDKARGVAK